MDIIKNIKDFFTTTVKDNGVETTWLDMPTRGRSLYPLRRTDPEGNPEEEVMAHKYDTVEELEERISVLKYVKDNLENGDLELPIYLGDTDFPILFLDSNNQTGKIIAEENEGT